MPDQNFDDLSNHFESHIYDSLKGQLRLLLLDEDLQQNGVLAQPELQVLDAGGGIGQFSARLAAQGHQITLCDLSAKMLDKARAYYANHAPDAAVRFIHSPLQELQEQALPAADLLLFHAVMEWLEDPQAALDTLLPLVKPGGWLSIMFYNKHALRWRYLTSAQFEEGMKEKFRRRPESLTPTNPQEPEAVHQWLLDRGLEVHAWTGIRCLYDNVFRPLRVKLTLEDVLEAERRYSRIPPYRDLGRYVHMLCRKPE
ncbi:methyltransferase [Pokkaliibacter sp. CJK22405]|uniref:methyltransferase n=1 Tax=Pokkaliibacter sp. CJK22405 TaxID=3384615 RepID=UPI00398493AA